MSLSKSEEVVMKKLWELKNAQMKDLMETYDDPKPAPTTLATLLKRMIDKGHVGYALNGKVRTYYPKLKEEKYVGKKFNNLVKTFFGDSQSQFASFFTQKSNMTKEELKALKKMIDQEIKKK